MFHTNIVQRFTGRLVVVMVEVLRFPASSSLMHLVLYINMFFSHVVSSWYISITSCLTLVPLLNT